MVFYSALYLDIMRNKEKEGGEEPGPIPDNQNKPCKSVVPK